MFVKMTFVLNRKSDRPLTAGLIAVSAVIWAAGGLCFGLAIWAISERKYRKYIESGSKGFPSSKL